MNDTVKQSKAATLARAAGFAGPIATAVGIAFAQFGAAPMIGFGLFQLGIVFGLAAMITGGIALYTTRAGVGGRSRALTGLGLGVLMVVIVLVGAAPGRGVPAINDITNNLEDPPVFAPAAAGHKNHGRDMSYPPGFVGEVERAYPDLAPMTIRAGTDDAYRRAVAAGEALGWEITRRDPASGTFEATATSALFRFVDDISVRVRPEADATSTIDIRSKSRDGRGDLGANAARIRAFAAKLEGQ